ncbi:hypothetical protein GOP47_0029109 [Adiantum capillus-veneris]|nr:hypothetical protein GOP47_0029109 [Adiantum capillus-veneris]
MRISPAIALISLVEVAQRSLLFLLPACASVGSTTPYLLGPLHDASESAVIGSLLRSAREGEGVYKDLPLDVEILPESMDMFLPIGPSG